MECEERKGGMKARGGTAPVQILVARGNGQTVAQLVSWVNQVLSPVGAEEIWKCEPQHDLRPAWVCWERLEERLPSVASSEEVLMEKYERVEEGLRERRPMVHRKEQTVWFSLPTDKEVWDGRRDDDGCARCCGGGSDGGLALAFCACM
ncbi:hypothetical protein PWT90_11214 [Aphanocladium album]|nr:hypothetical protein PWT90_11214 [Aphanocladium album]